MFKTGVELVSSHDSSTYGFLAHQVDPQRYNVVGRPHNECFELITRLIPTGARVLDIGCGSGSLAVLLRAQCHAQVIGIEPDSERALRSRDLGLEIFEGALTPELVEQIGLFDVIVLADVLEHLVNPLELLQLSKNFLRPNGFLVLSVPNVAHWTVRLNLFRGKFDYSPVGIMDATHLRWFTARTLEQMLGIAGFQPIQHCLSVGLDNYIYWWPWYRLSPSVRRRLILWLTKRWPELMAYQYVLKVGLSAQPASQVDKYKNEPIQWITI